MKNTNNLIELVEDKNKLNKSVWQRYINSSFFNKLDEENVIEESIQLEKEVFEHLTKLSLELKIDVNKLINIILTEMIALNIEGNNDIENSLSSFMFQELLIEAENNKELEASIFKEKTLIVDSLNIEKRFIWIPEEEYLKLKNI